MGSDHAVPEEEHGGEKHREHDDGAVLTAHERLRTLLDGVGDPLHRLAAGGVPQHPAGEVGRKDQTEDAETHDQDDELHGAHGCLPFTLAARGGSETSKIRVTARHGRVADRSGSAQGWVPGRGLPTMVARLWHGVHSVVRLTSDVKGFP
jgi:hypothetical protein